VINAQNIIIKGRILDETNQQPIPFTNICVKQCGIGTISNSEGFFRLVLPQNATKYDLTIIQIGYKSKYISLANLEKDYSILLTPNPILMEEVLVVPDDFIKRLIKNAYDSIKRNYPISATLYTGFYRDAQFMNDTIYLSFIEAILNVFKDGYLNSHGTGQITIKKSRKYNRPGIDSLNNVQFYGGAFLPVDFDFVYSQASFINPASFRKYTYKISEAKNENGNDTYTVFFFSKDTSSGISKGSFVLDKKTLAYLEIMGNKQLPAKILNLTPFHWRNIDYTIKYQEFMGKMHLSYAFVKSNGYNIYTEKDIYKEREFVTTSIKTDSVRPIPFKEQLQYSDVINLKSENYAISDWKDYTILEPSQRFSTQNELKYDQEESIDILAQNNPVKFSKRELTARLFKRIDYRIGLNVASYSTSNVQYSLCYIDNKLNYINATTQSEAFKYFPTLISELHYRINRQFGAFYQTRTCLNEKYKLNDWNLGFRYQKLLLPNNSKWLININIKYSSYKLQLSYGIIKNDNELQIARKTYDASRIKLYSGKHYSGTNLGIGIVKKMGRLISIYLESSYFLKIEEKDIAQFTEGSGFFLGRKTHTMSLKSNGITLLKDSKPVNEISFKENLPVNISLGLSFDL
jgi:hypothetical protein